MEWNVYYHNINSQKIETYNIFNHHAFNEYIKLHLRKCRTKEEFSERLKSELNFYFWSKAEWEIIIAPWCGGRDTKDIKIDVYDQVMNNYDIFLDYVWSNKIKFTKEKTYV